MIKKVSCLIMVQLFLLENGGEAVQL